MPRTQRLDPAQRRVVEHLALHQGCVCIECGSSDYLESAGKAVQFLGHIGVEVYCTNEEHPAKVLALGESFPLTFAQARAIGLRVPPSDPPPQRNPGEGSPSA
jgi:aldehyde:ferredoxin oxidoreductase